MNTVSYFLIRCSGANMEVLSKCPKHEQTRFAQFGGFISGTAALAGFSCGYFLYSSFKSIWTSLLFATVWALIIFNMDQYFVTSMDACAGFRKKAASGISRFLLALLISFFVSETLLLNVYRTEISEQLSKRLQKEKTEIHAGYNHKEGLLKKEFEDRQLAVSMFLHQEEDKYNAFRADAEAKKAKLKEEMTNPGFLTTGACQIAEIQFQAAVSANTAKIDALRKRIEKEENWTNTLHKRHLDECAGKDGTLQPGPGPECNRTKQAYLTAKQELSEIRRANLSKIAVLEKEIEDKNADRLLCLRSSGEKMEKEFQDRQMQIQARMDVIENDIREKENALMIQKKLSTAEREEAKQQFAAEKEKMNKERTDDIHRKVSVFSDGPLARVSALNELTRNNASLMISAIILQLILILLETAPILTKLMQKPGVYDYMIQTIQHKLVLEQHLQQDIDKDIASKQSGYLKAKALEDITHAAKHNDIMNLYRNYQSYSEGHSEYAEKFFQDMGRMISEASHIRNRKLQTIAIENIKELIQTYETVRDAFFVKIREMFKGQTPYESFDDKKKRFRVLN